MLSKQKDSHLGMIEQTGNIKNTRFGMRKTILFYVMLPICFLELAL